MAFDFDTFVIVPPSGDRVDNPAMITQIDYELHRRFPHCQFTFDQKSRERSPECFTVIIKGSRKFGQPRPDPNFKITPGVMATVGQWLTGSVSMDIGMFLNTTFLPFSPRHLH